MFTKEKQHQKNWHKNYNGCGWDRCNCRRCCKTAMTIFKHVLDRRSSESTDCRSSKTCFTKLIYEIYYSSISFYKWTLTFSCRGHKCGVCFNQRNISCYTFGETGPRKSSSSHRWSLTLKPYRCQHTVGQDNISRGLILLLWKDAMLLRCTGEIQCLCHKADPGLSRAQHQLRLAPIPQRPSWMDCIDVTK